MQESPQPSLREPIFRTLLHHVVFAVFSMKSFCNEILILSSINLVKLHGYYRDPTFLPQGIIDGVIIWWEDKGEATAYGGGVEEEHAMKEAEEEHHDNVCDLLSSWGVDVDNVEA